ncbi:hypothetical protein BS47DRAFT_1403500 [Hydnum rufescens UP504]|uniref:Uncharacterized protein n=1 Tax=Hydnum rufescens UP504 TaxID=1448309 RepID=A0A9P6DLJ2_9AGAM|nr:hypothetical protein BS47DRAFT_1403500 [Hydnum rufescens UP504]
MSGSNTGDSDSDGYEWDPQAQIKKTVLFISPKDDDFDVPMTLKNINKISMSDNCEGLTGKAAEWAVQKQKGHHAVSHTIQR